MGKELIFCNKNSEKIFKIAKKTYDRFCYFSNIDKNNRSDYQNWILNNTGDFKLYEEICKFYIIKEKKQEEKKKQIKKEHNIKQKTSFNDIKKSIAEYKKSKKENSENLINKKTKNNKIEH